MCILTLLHVLSMTMVQIKSVYDLLYIIHGIIVLKQKQHLQRHCYQNYYKKYYINLTNINLKKQFDLKSASV